MQNTPEDAIAKLEADYEAQIPGDWEDVIAPYVRENFFENAPHILGIHNATPALLAVARAAAEVAPEELVRVRGFIQVTEAQTRLRAALADLGEAVITI